MAATAAHTSVPVEVYLRSSYEPDAEYVDGEIEERPMGEYEHSSWQGDGFSPRRRQGRKEIASGSVVLRVLCDLCGECAQASVIR
ncbi:hypothetical protein HNQ77_000106 [Silvibacterium bohemicum]|uniref:Uncharacterized protein n=1 Tax=Silvibacterium bohemicum TaxID=1577686 RepID=A0A841JUS0_9BACT|nr:hypothetical protein [Silvibacterium bohemicum]MBB6142168.1 hypothetical protein [Silvibacterium bohemicum]